MDKEIRIIPSRGVMKASEEPISPQALKLRELLQRQMEAKRVLEETEEIFKPLEQPIAKPENSTSSPANSVISFKVAGEFIFDLAIKLYRELVPYIMQVEDTSGDDSKSRTEEISIYYGIFCCIYIVSKRYGVQFSYKLSQKALSSFIHNRHPNILTLPKQEMYDIIDLYRSGFDIVWDKCADIVNGYTGNIFARDFLYRFCERLIKDIWGDSVVGETHIMMHLTFASWFVQTAEMLSKFHIETDFGEVSRESSPPTDQNYQSKQSQLEAEIPNSTQPKKATSSKSMTKWSGVVIAVVTAIIILIILLLSTNGKNSNYFVGSDKPLIQTTPAGVSAETSAQVQSMVDEWAKEIQATPAAVIPQSGEILTGFEYFGGSEITVTASNNADCVVKLKSKDGITKLSFYVRAGDTVTVGVPAEYMYVYFASGETWYGWEKMFGSSTYYSKDDEILDFVRYTWEYTLSPISNGNFNETPVDEEEFK